MRTLPWHLWGWGWIAIRLNFGIAFILEIDELVHCGLRGPRSQLLQELVLLHAQLQQSHIAAYG
jgi:hypothetical protein